MSELKTLATCNPYEFLAQTNRIKESVEKWLTVTDVLNIRKRTAALEMVPKDGTPEERQAVFELSADYQHKTAKKGFEQEHEAAVIRVSLLEEMLEAAE